MCFARILHVEKELTRQGTSGSTQMVGRGNSRAYHYPTAGQFSSPGPGYSETPVHGISGMSMSKKNLNHFGSPPASSDINLE